jgi:hypothetical protein
VGTTLGVLALHPVARYRPRGRLQINLFPSRWDDLANRLRRERADVMCPPDALPYFGLVGSTQYRAHAILRQRRRQMGPVAGGLVASADENKMGRLQSSGAEHPPEY